MKEIDVLPRFKPLSLKFPEISIFSYNGKLKNELEKGEISEGQALNLFKAMVLVRNFEYMVTDLDTGRFTPYDGFRFYGATHLYVGEEANAAGIMSSISKNDYITSTHRGHGHVICKGLFAIYEMNEDELNYFLRSASDDGFPIKKYGNNIEAAIDYHIFKAMSELLGKEEGYCHGRGGSMHIADYNTGNLGANAIVGGSLAIATGAAMAIQ
ncbi:MAG TPA: thiamine pyrophosphate-dependent enzyme, partial [Thermodesulfobacteriota bacterium]|nr:thiamine pyrophosphate-dependent enzyme [Thermodesulfobacteriota bacterium]